MLFGKYELNQLENDINDPSEMIQNIKSENHKLLTELNTARTASKTAQTEKYDNLFICGVSGTKGADGLPESIEITPSYGMAGSARYRKITDYSEPGY